MEVNKLEHVQEQVEDPKPETTQEPNNEEKTTGKVLAFLSKFTTKQKVIGAVAILVVYTLIVGVVSANIQKRVLANRIQKSFEESFFVGKDSLNEEKNPVKSDKKEKKNEQQEPKDITVNETVTTDNYEFTLNKVELSYDVKPENPPSYYMHYPAPDGKVYIYVNAMVKNLAKKSIECDEIYSVLADYNGGYEYTGFHVVSDKDGDFTYANIANIDPLETRGVHCLVECPVEVENSTDKPLFITITLKDGAKYKYQIR